MKPTIVPLLTKDVPRTPRDVHTPKTNMSNNESFRSPLLSPENLLQNHLIKKLNKVIDHQPALTSRSNTKDYSSGYSRSPSHANNQVQLPKIAQEVKLDSNTKYFIKNNFDHFATKDKYKQVNSSVPDKLSAFTFRPLTKNFKYLFPGASHHRSSEKLILGPIVLSPTSPRGNKIRQISVRDFMGPNIFSPQPAGSKTERLKGGVKFNDLPKGLEIDDIIKPPEHIKHDKHEDAPPNPRKSFMRKATLIRPKMKMKKMPLIRSDPSLDEMERYNDHLEMINESNEGSRTYAYNTDSDLH